MAPVCLQGLWDFLLASRQHFLSEGLFSCFPSGVSHMAGAISPAGTAAYGFCAALQGYCSKPKVYDPPDPPPHT